PHLLNLATGADQTAKQLHVALLPASSRGCKLLTIDLRPIEIVHKIVVSEWQLETHDHFLAEIAIQFVGGILAERKHRQTGIEGVKFAQKTVRDEFRLNQGGLDVG